MQATISDLLGKPFTDGGRGPDAYDCWGLACEVFRRYGIELPDYQVSCYAPEQIDSTYRDQVSGWVRVSGIPPVPSLVVIRFNQVIFCNHVGVYIGDGRFIHAREKTGVCVESVNHIYWARKVEGYYVPGWLK